MSLVYFKRYRMQIELPFLGSAQCADETVRFVSWQDSYLTMHAIAKWESFRFEMDANVFPCLGDKDGCRQLMRDLSQKNNFVPEATWLAIHTDETNGEETPVGTIQGLRTGALEGAIQNIGVVPAWRGSGIGRVLIARSLHGFESIGCRYVSLEVTYQNTAAMRLYESLGFQQMETVFKAGNVPFG